MRGLWAAFAFGTTIGIISSASSVALGDDSGSNVPAASVPESGAEDESPDALMTRGIEFRKRREDRLALAAFERAWTLGGAPRALAQMALAEQALGLWREADEHLARALKHSDDPWIASHRTPLEVALAEIASRLGAVEISCNVDGAEVKIDGRLVGHTPLPEPLRVVAGNSVVQARLDGYFDAVRQVQVDARDLARVDLTLTPVPRSTAETAPALPSLPSPASPSVRSKPLEPTLVTPPAPPRAPSPSTRDILTYTSAGLAALGVTAGITGYVMREVNVRLYNDNERCSQRDGLRRSVECESEFAAWRRGEVIAIAGASAAGVFGLAAAYLWWSRPEVDDSDVSCWIGPRSVSCSSTF